MSMNPMSFLSGALLFTALAIVPAATSGGYLGQSEVAGDTLVYLGVVPVTVLDEDTDANVEHNMQCPVHRGRHSYHVMVALFDKSSGARIVDAEVNARVSPLGLVGPLKHFGPVVVADALVYCNYFDMPPYDTYEIKVLIGRPGKPGAVQAKFKYRPFDG